jgi:NADH-quinone oxidoreductase subunit N
MIPAPQLDFAAIVPLLVVSVGAFVVLCVDLALRGGLADWRPARIGAALSLLSSAILAVAFAAACSDFASGAIRVFDAGHPLVQVDPFASFSIAVISLASLLSCLLSVRYLHEQRINHGEYYALILLATSGMILLVGAVDLVSVFLGIEILSIPIYVLAGFQRRNLRSNESALKYFLVGSFASALLLYGMALLYGATGATHFDALRARLDPSQPLAMMGLALVLVGFAFKVSSVPFHQWTPDVYEGAPTPVTAFMSVTVKAAAFAGLLRIVVGSFGAAEAGVRDVLLVLSALTMIVGNVMAVVQDNVKRLLAYSSIAHAGYLLMGFVAGTPHAYAAVLFYLLAYVFMNLGAFGVLVGLAHGDREVEKVDDLAGLARTRPRIAALMTLFVISLAGIPGTAGFTAKLTLFMATVRAEYVGLTVLAVMTSLVSVYYYLRIPVAMYMREAAGETRRSSLHSGEMLALGFCALAVVVLGVLPNNGPDDLLSWLRAIDWSRDSVAQFAGK